MRTGKKGIELIKHFEGLHDGDLTLIGLQPKMCPAGIWTEGYGNAIIDPETGHFLRGAANKKRAYELSTIRTEEEAEKALDHVLWKKFEPIVKRKIKVALTQNQFDAVVSHTYNTGGSDTLFRLINQSAPKDAIYNWFTTKYIKADGKQLPGLVKRRKAEAELFFS